MPTSIDRNSIIRQNIPRGIDRDNQDVRMHGRRFGLVGMKVLSWKYTQMPEVIRDSVNRWLFELRTIVAVDCAAKRLVRNDTENIE